MRSSIADKIAYYAGPASFVAALWGLVACRFVHLFGAKNVKAAISTELVQQNPLAWLFIVAFAALVAIAFLFQLGAKNRIHAVILGIAFIAITVIAMVHEGKPLHEQALIYCIACLFISTAWLGAELRLLEAVVVWSILGSIVIGAMLLILGGQFRVNPGMAEKLAFCFYALITVYCLNSLHPRYGWIAK